MADVLFAYDALWEHQAATNETPADPALVVVPASDWLGPDPAPFGGNVEADVDYPLASDWPPTEALWLRRALVVDGRHPVQLTGRIENACYLYFDGAFVGAVNPSNAQRTTALYWSLIIPKELATEGTHELAILCVDELGATPEGSGTYVFVEAAYLPPLFPFWPSTPLRETLEWVTDVLIADSGTEARSKVRVVPRQSLAMSFYIPRPYQRLASNIIYGNRTKQWMVPIWPFVQALGAVAAGTTQIDVATDVADFRDNSAALIWQSPEHWQIVSVDQVVNASTLSLNQPTTEFTDAYIVPLLPGFLSDAPQRDFSGARSRARLNFVIEDNKEIAVSAPTQYLGYDIYFEPGLLDGDMLSENIEADFNVLDEGIGAVSYFSPWLFNRPARVHRMMGEDLTEGWGNRKWLHRRAGRFRPFWLPTFEADLRVTSTGALTTTLSVASDDYLAYASDRTHIAVETAAGWLARAITEATQIDEDAVQLTLDSSLAVDSSAIKRVSFLGLKRLDADRVEIEWVGNQVSKIAVPVLEIEP